MKKTFFIFCFLFFSFFISNKIEALTFGTLLYKTGENGRMYGLNEFKFSPFVGNKYLGGVGIYIGKIEGEPSVVEVSYGQVRIIPARFFIDLDKGEEFVGAKIPKDFTLMRVSKINILEHIRCQVGEKEDFAFREQKGPLNGLWTSVGLAEKIYESLNNSFLTYHPRSTGLNPFYYTIDITPDGYDNIGAINDSGDCFSQTKEFSKIHHFGHGDFWENFAFKEVKKFFEALLKKDLGVIDQSNFFGKKNGSDFYIFSPYTQYLQPTLTEAKLDIPIASYGKKNLPDMFSEGKLEKETFLAVAERVLTDLGVSIVKQFSIKKLHLDKIIGLFNDIKERLVLVESGLQFLGVKVDLSKKMAIIPQKITEKILEKNKFISGSVGEIKETFNDLGAGLKEGQEIAEREEKGLLSGPEAEKKIEEFVSKFDEEEESGQTQEEAQKPEEKQKETQEEKEKQDKAKKKEQEQKDKQKQKQEQKPKQDKVKPTEIPIKINSGDLVINEIYSYPKEDEPEWIEIYNKTDKKIELKGFTIEDNTGPEFGSGRLTKLDNLFILPKGFLVLTKGEDFNFSLNNKGDILILKYGEKIIDKVAYGDFDDGQVLNNAPLPLQNEAVARLFDGKDTGNDLKDFALTSELTPGRPNKIVMPGRLKADSGGVGGSDDLQSPSQTTSQSSSQSSSPSLPLPSSQTNIYYVYQPPPPSPAPIYHSYNYLNVVINEIAWMGTQAEAVDEWIELLNTTEESIDLSGWILESQDGSLKTSLSGVIPAYSFWLLERTDDTTIIDIEADQIYQGSLADSGEILELRDGKGNLIDFIDCFLGWFAGDKESQSSMERIDPKVSGNLATNWQTNNGQKINGYDKNSQPIFGTPKAENSPPLEEKNIVFQNSILTRDLYNLYNWSDKIEGQAAAYTSTTNALKGVMVSLKSEKLNKYWQDNLSWSEEPIYHLASLDKKSGFLYYWLLNTSSTLSEDHYFLESFSFSQTQRGTTSTSEFILDKNPPPVPENLFVFYDREKDELNFSWSEVQDFSGIDHYQVYWWENEVQNTAASNETNFVIKSPQEKEYAFKVKVYDKSGLSSDWSEKIFFKDKMADWRERKKVVIDNSQNANNLKDFEVDAEILYEPEMNSDFSDIRFTDSDGQTLLDFGWEINDNGEEMKIDNVSSIAVVKIPYIPAYSTKTIYLYYANPSAPTAANLAKAMTWFDHFEDANTTNNYDYAYWTWDTANSRLNLGTSNVDAYLVPKNLLIKDFIFRIRYWRNNNYDDCYRKLVAYRFQDQNNYFSYARYPDIPDRPCTTSNYHLIKKKDNVITALANFTPKEPKENWQTLKIFTYETEHSFLHSYFGKVDFVTEDLNTEGLLRLGDNAYYDMPVYYDYLYIRKNTKPMPIVSVKK